MKAIFAQGAAALAAGDYDTADRVFRTIVEQDPAAHQAWLALAVVAVRAGSPELAIEHARRALALDRNNPDYLNQLGIAYREHGELRAAEQALRRALKTNPAHAGAHHNLAKALQKQGRLDESLKEFERAHTLAPDSTAMRLSLCGMYRLHGDPERALAVLRAGELDPALVPQLADCMADVEGPYAAVAWLRNVLAHQPNSQPAHYALAVMLLSIGEWREGWKHYLWRPRSGEIPHALPKQEKILLRAEYGLGDVLFFLRFAPLLQAPFALKLPPQLAKVAPLLAGRVELTEAGEAQAGLVDLPSLLDVNSTPPAFPLRASIDAREKLARLGPPPYLGLAWRAGTDFNEIAPALLGGAVCGWPGTLVSLQRAPGEDELRAVGAAAGAEVRDLSAANEDLQEMLAILALLDDYVTISDTNVHLRAGLGRTARVLVPNPPGWRWMRAGGASPWFPGFSVYRQPPSRDWRAPLAQLRRDLATAAGSPPRAPA